MKASLPVMIQIRRMVFFLFGSLVLCLVYLDASPSQFVASSLKKTSGQKLFSLFLEQNDSEKACRFKY